MRKQITGDEDTISRKVEAIIVYFTELEKSKKIRAPFLNYSADFEMIGNLPNSSKNSGNKRSFPEEFLKIPHFGGYAVNCRF